MKFDNTKPYGQIFGEFGQAKWEQGGRYYDSQFNLLDGDGMPLLNESAKQPDTQAQTSAPDAQYDKDALIAEAKALGIAATKNWGEAKLIEAIADAKAKAAEKSTEGAQASTDAAKPDEGTSTAVDSQIEKSLG